MVLGVAQKFYELWMRLKRGARFRSALEKRSFLTRNVEQMSAPDFLKRDKYEASTAE